MVPLVLLACFFTCLKLNCEIQEEPFTLFSVSLMLGYLKLMLYYIASILSGSCKSLFLSIYGLLASNLCLSMGRIIIKVDVISNLACRGFNYAVISMFA